MLRFCNLFIRVSEIGFTAHVVLVCHRRGEANSEGDNNRRVLYDRCLRSCSRPYACACLCSTAFACTITSIPLPSPCPQRRASLPFLLHQQLLLLPVRCFSHVFASISSSLSLFRVVALVCCIVTCSKCFQIFFSFFFLVCVFACVHIPSSISLPPIFPSLIL